jgi:hypothetical protein
MNDYTAFRNACQTILNSPKTNEYARAYALMGVKIANGVVPPYIAGMSVTQEEMIQSQALYILSNIQHWRDPSAKSVRAILKAFTKE